MGAGDGDERRPHPRAPSGARRARASWASSAARGARAWKTRSSSCAPRCDEHPERREMALFLAEAELRSDAITSAIDTLRATIARDRAPRRRQRRRQRRRSRPRSILTLVRLLRQTRQLDEAVRLLADLAQRIPSRAREAHIQIADIELGRYEDQQALDHAELGGAPGARRRARADPDRRGAGARGRDRRGARQLSPRVRRATPTRARRSRWRAC